MNPVGDPTSRCSASHDTPPADDMSAVDGSETRHPCPAGQLTVARASQEEWRQVEEWAAAEGWNPGHGDVACFHPTDPAGFFLGRLDGEPVSAVSVVTYSDRFAFLGYYLVHPDQRRRGMGLATWRAAIPHAGNRTIGLDAVPAQQATYQRAGFTAVHQTIRYSGRPGRPAPPRAAVPVTPALVDAIAAYDQECFPAERGDFVNRWLTAPRRIAYALLRDGDITGYGVIRPARSGQRIGPLFADTPDGAEVLFDALTSHLGPDGEVSLDIPEPHDAACALAKARGLTSHFHTVRMYTGPVPRTRADRVYGVTSLELG